MAKRNRKGGWTGTAAGSGAVRSGSGPQVEKNTSELRKYESKRTPLQKAARLLLFVLACVLAGSLIHQTTPKSMAEYWGLDAQKDAISAIEITVYMDEGEDAKVDFTNEAEIEVLYNVLQETKLKRLWFADKEAQAFTSEIQVYVNGEKEPAYEVGFVEDRVFFLHMPTYDWYLAEDAPLRDFIKIEE